jgi:hypothetical protein
MTEESTIPSTSAAQPDQFLDISIHLKQRLSPLPGMGMNDIVHLSSDEVISLPCLPFMGKKEELSPMKVPAENDSKAMQPSESVKNPDHLVHLIQRLSPLSGMGMNDVVHLSGDEVISVPCLPFMGEDGGKGTTNEETAASPASRKLKAGMIAVNWATNLNKTSFATTMSPQGFNDVVHLPDGSVISVPMLPFHHSKLARK